PSAGNFQPARWRHLQIYARVRASFDLSVSAGTVLVPTPDRFEGRAKRVLDITEVEDWVVSEVSAIEPLTVIDLRTTGLLKLGVTTNAARAKHQAAGRRLSKALYDSFAVDGVLYSSRLTSAECLAVYDRAVKPKLRSNAAVGLVRHAGLISALTAINVSVRGLG
uniref:hypothetical protein n=1 Tax=Mesorhizobium comanense TaxID=2502215 RepID=UPI001AED1977